MSKIPNNQAWVIKLGTAGVCIPFCESKKIVGIGWRMVDPKIVSTGSKVNLWDHVSRVCGFYQCDKRKISQAVGQLYRFGQECNIGDYIFYYDPPKKIVRICRVTSGPMYRDFDKNDNIDIWHYRQVEYPVKPIPVLDFHGSLKGKLLGPRMSFWTMDGGREYAHSLIIGKPIHSDLDKEYAQTYSKLKFLLVKRSEALNHRDWEFLAVDFFRSKGAIVDERHTGGSGSIIDVEALFDRGELGQERWRTQVKCLKDRKVDWADIEKNKWSSLSLTASAIRN